MWLWQAYGEIYWAPLEHTGGPGRPCRPVNPRCPFCPLSPWSPRSPLSPLGPWGPWNIPQKCPVIVTNRQDLTQVNVFHYSRTLTTSPLFPAAPGGPTGPLEPCKQVNTSEGLQETENFASASRRSICTFYPNTTFLSFNTSLHVPTRTLSLNQITCSWCRSGSCMPDRLTEHKDQRQKGLTMSPLLPAPPVAPTGPAGPGSPWEPSRPSGPWSPRSPWGWEMIQISQGSQHSKHCAHFCSDHILPFVQGDPLCPVGHQIQGGPKGWIEDMSRTIGKSFSEKDQTLTSGPGSPRGPLAPGRPTGPGGPFSPGCPADPSFPGGP